MIGTVAPIAIVGVALVFPGANDALAFHDLTLSGQRMFRLDPTVDLDPVADPGTAGTGTTGAGPAGTGTFGWYYDGTTIWANDPASDVDVATTPYNTY